MPIKMTSRTYQVVVAAMHSLPVALKVPGDSLTPIPQKLQDRNRRQITIATPNAFELMGWDVVLQQRKKSIRQADRQMTLKS